MVDKRTILIFSQVFIPDPASVGQHMADVAIELARRGHEVLVYCSARGYDNPSIRYASREVIRGVKIRRLPFSSFGKRSILTRLTGTVSFMLQVFFLALFRRGDLIFFSTSPPMIGLVISFARFFRRRPAAYWAMDLNPDQLIALGKIKPRGLVARMLEWGNRVILRRSTLVIALDRFMAARLSVRADLQGKLEVIPPWPHEESLAEDPRSPSEPHVPHLPHASDSPEHPSHTSRGPCEQDAAKAAEAPENLFRRQFGLADKFVVMYSGNHSPSNPLETLLLAAERMRDDPSVIFMFIGGGVGKKAVEEFVLRKQLANTICLPYQPMEQLRHSLPAGDVHAVSLGEQMAGIVHPCKIYGAMAVARPVLFLGPKPSHIADLLEAYGFGEHVMHGDVEGMVEAIGRMRDLFLRNREALRRMGVVGQGVLQRQLSQTLLCGKLCDKLEAACASNKEKGKRKK